MKKLALSVLAATAALTLTYRYAVSDGRLSPQGGTVVSVTPTSGGGVTVSGTVANPTIGLLPTCTSGQTLSWSGTAWGCTTILTTVFTNSTLTGDGSSGSPLGLAPCSSGQVFIYSGSAWACGTISAISGLTTNRLPKATSGTTIGDSSIADNGTAVSTTESFAAASVIDNGNRVLSLCGSGLSCGSAPTLNLNLGAASCSAGAWIQSLTSGGTATCSSVAIGGTAGNVAIYSTGGNSLTTSYAGTSCTSGQAVTSLNGAATATCNPFFNATGAGLSSTGSTVNLNLSGASCSAGSFVTAISSTGTGTCTSGISGSSGGILKSNGAGAAVASSLMDNGTVVSTSEGLTIGGLLDFGEIIGTTIYDVSSSSVVNNYNPTGLANATTIILENTITAAHLCGIVTPSDSRLLYLTIVGTPMYLANNNDGSCASASGSYFLTQTGADSLIVAGQTVELIWDNNANSWRVFEGGSTQGTVGQTATFDTAGSVTAGWAQDSGGFWGKAGAILINESNGNINTAGTLTVSGSSSFAAALSLGAATQNFIYSSLGLSSGNQDLDMSAAGTGAVRINYNAGGIANAGTGGLVVYGGANGSTPEVTLAANGAITAVSATFSAGLNVSSSGITAGGDVKASGHVVSTAPAPTLTTCGTSPTITGKDQLFQFTPQSTSCTLTFTEAWTGSAPICEVHTLAGVFVVPTITASTLTFSATVTSGTTYQGICGPS